MQITSENAATTDLLGDVETVAGGFDSESMGILQDILSNVYTHTQEAILREYVTNALDSHARAVVNDPVEVTLPNQYEPTFTVTDHGLGLSGDEVVSLFGEYVRSTKRDSNNEAGFFGIGSKVGYTETSQFTVTAVKDSLRNVVLFTLGDDGASRSMRVATDVPVKQGNGVTVEVPFRDHDGVADKAAAVYATLATGALLIDGEPNVCVLDEADLRIEGGHIIRQSGTASRRDRQVRVVMGGIAYSLDQTWNQRLLRAAGQPCGSLYLSADMGAVRPLPNREALRDSDANRAWLAEQEATLPARFAKGLERELSKEPTALAAADKAAHHPLVLQRMTSFRWRGRNYESIHSGEHSLYEVEERGAGFATRAIKQGTHVYELAGKKVGYILAPDGLAGRDGLARYAAHREWDYVLIVDKASGHDGVFAWGADDEVVPVERFRREAKKLAATTGRSTGKARLYRAWMPGDAEPVEATQDVIVGTCGRYGNRIGFMAVQSAHDWKLRAMLAGFPVVIQTQRRQPAKTWAKAGLKVTDVPFVPVDWGRLDKKRARILDRLLASVSQTEIDAATLGRFGHYLSRHLDLGSVADDRLNEAMSCDLPERGSLLREIGTHPGMWSRCSFGDDYPVLPSLLFRQNIADIEQYINDMYELKTLREATKTL